MMQRRNPWRKENDVYLGDTDDAEESKELRL